MQRHKQLLSHDPENGVHGDCMRTAIACLLDIAPQDVPHFLHDGCDGGVFMERIDAYLASHGLALVGIPFADTPENVMEAMMHTNPNMTYLLSGQSIRGVNHVVIARNGEVIWDTHTSNVGLSGPCKDGHTWVEFLVSRKAHKTEAHHDHP